MRNYIFLIFFLPLPILSMVMPWIGMLVWTWLALLSPHRVLWDQFAQQPYNQIIAIAVMIGLAVGQCRRRWFINPTFILLVIIGILIVVSTATSLAPNISWGKFQDFTNVIIHALILSVFLTDRFRFEMIILLIVFIMGYFGSQGGVLFSLSGGGHDFTGPPGTAIGDRNHLALAMVMALPLLNYFREQFVDARLRWLCILVMILTALAIVGTGSRGGFVAMAAVGLTLAWRAKRKFATIFLLLALATIIAQLAPTEWWQRMQTIETAQEEDNSFKLRLLSWQAHWQAALDRPFTGAGVYALNDRAVFMEYSPFEAITDVQNNKGRAAHSIYFQVIGELGFITFAFYAALAVIAWFNCSKVIACCRGHVDLSWASDLARMIQASFLGFFVGGAAVSMAFYDVYLMLVVIAACLKTLVVEQSSVKTSKKVSA